MVIVGLDLGGSTTKAVAMEKKRVRGYSSIRASDPISSASGALGKLLHELSINLEDVREMAVTGVGISSLPNNILGLKTMKIDEIIAIGYGGAFLSGKKRALVVSIGTGTAMVAVDAEKEVFEHVGGTGVGGGTLYGLGKALLRKSELESIVELAERGDLKRVDLTVGELAGKSVGILGEDVTASNFGKVNDKTRDEDLAKGLINMVGQVIGSVAYFAAKSRGLTEEIVYIGRLLNIKLLSESLLEVTKVFGGKCIIPEKPEYGTAIGAALAVKKTSTPSLR